VNTLQAFLTDSKAIELLPSATPLVQWQDVSTSALAHYAPSDTTLIPSGLFFAI